MAAARRAALGAPRAFSTQLAHQGGLSSSMEFSRHRATKIVATIGPASLPILDKMLLAGMNVARINCAHGDAAQWTAIAAAVRAAERAVRADGRADGRAGLAGSRADVAALALDVKGPEIRVGRFGASVPAGAGGAQKEVPLRAGDRVTLTTDAAEAAAGTRERLFVSYPALARQAVPGQTIFVDDGNVELVVVRADAARGEILCESRTTAPLGERKNVNLPGLVVDLPAVTAKDEADIALARALGADFIFASFVQSAAAVREIRARAGPDVRIISKIESQAGLDAYDEILSASDGIMVARGDLGVQIPAECVFIAQKMMIAKANVAGKPIITATQMLDSMVKSPRPTRAEVVDVASAVLDGTDAVMLSGETSKGAHPLEAVATMARTCRAAEAAFPAHAFFAALSEHPGVPVGADEDEAFALHEARARAAWRGRDAAAFMTIADVETLGGAAVHAAFEVKAAAIVVLSLSGRTAAAVAKYRPAVPVLCLVADEPVARALQLTRGVHAVLVREAEVGAGAAAAHDVPALKALAMRLVRDLGVARKGERVVVLHGHGAAMTEGVAVTIAVA